jgi:hypothetical protein
MGESMDGLSDVLERRGEANAAKGVGERSSIRARDPGVAYGRSPPLSSLTAATTTRSSRTVDRTSPT